MSQHYLERGDKPQLVQAVHARAKRAHARENDGVGGCVGEAFMGGKKNCPFFSSFPFFSFILFLVFVPGTVKVCVAAHDLKRVAEKVDCIDNTAHVAGAIVKEENAHSGKLDKEGGGGKSGKEKETERKEKQESQKKMNTKRSSQKSEERLFIFSFLLFLFFSLFSSLHFSFLLLFLLFSNCRLGGR